MEGISAIMNSKIRKAKIEEENARIGYEDALKGLQANYMNAVSEGA